MTVFKNNKGVQQRDRRVTGNRSLLLLRRPSQADAWPPVPSFLLYDRHNKNYTPAQHFGATRFITDDADGIRRKTKAGYDRNEK
jgi:hypothetical protein